MSAGLWYTWMWKAPEDKDLSDRSSAKSTTSGKMSITATTRMNISSNSSAPRDAGSPRIKSPEDGVGLAASYSHEVAADVTIELSSMSEAAGDNDPPGSPASVFVETAV